MNQHVKKPTRKTAILDHIITNFIAKVKNVNVIPCPEVSDHDAPSITLSTKFAPFEPRYKIIRDMKNFRQQDFIDSFATLPLELVYAFNDPNDMISVFNELISNHINEHAPLKTIRVTCPTAPWMKDTDIVDLQQKCHQLRTLCHTTNRETDWNDFRNVRNKLKTKIKSTKSNFYRKALSSKKSSEVWKVIHKILNPNGKRIRINPNELNKHFSTTSKQLTCRNNADLQVLKYIINNMSPSSVNKPSFKLRSASYKETLQEVKSIRNDCSTGNDNIPISLVKLVAANIASPLTYIINECIRLFVFSAEWKCARISVTPKIDNPTTGDYYRPISILPVLSKVL